MRVVTVHCDFQRMIGKERLEKSRGESKVVLWLLHNVGNLGKVFFFKQVSR